jgi:hypothetical protein
MKRLLALAGAVALLSGWGIQAAQAAPGDISAVKIAWSDATHTKIRISWSETTPVANSLTWMTDSQVVAAIGSTSAGGPNELVVGTGSFGPTVEADAKTWIVVSDPAGDEARSVDFDRFVYYQADVQLSFAADGTLHWTAAPDTVPDGTPGDPLDLPKAYRYALRQRVDNDPAGMYDCKDVPASGPTSSRTGVVPRLGTASALLLDISNEWGTSATDAGFVETTAALTIAAPTATQYGTSATFTGKLTAGFMFIRGMPPFCDQQLEPRAGQTLTLQARPIGATAWSVVGTTQTDANGNYKLAVKNLGTRQYRVVRATTASRHTSPFGGDTAAYGGSSASKVVRTSTRVMSAKFIAPVINYGTKPQAYLWVDPAGSQRAALQFKNASGAWQGVMYKMLSSGRGIATFAWNRRGATQFRWWVPGSTTSAGLKVDPVYTGAFTLTVR